MKRTKIAVAALLAVCAISFASCSNQGQSNKATADSTSVSLNIRYVNMDSVLSDYTLAKELVAEQQKALLEYQKIEQQKNNELQRMQKTMEQKLNSNGYLTEATFRADQEKLQKTAEASQKLLLDRQAQVNQLVEQQTLRINDSIRNAMKLVSHQNGFDAVLDDKMTYYVNPSLDVTEMVIEALNARYTPAE